MNTVKLAGFGILHFTKWNTIRGSRGVAARPHRPFRFIQRTIPFLVAIGLAANTTVAAQVEFVGDYSFDLNTGDSSVTVEIEQLRNASRTESTGPLFVALRYTQCDAASSYGVFSFEPDEGAEKDARPGYFSLDRVVPGADSKLAAQASWMDIRFTTKYRAPPSGTHRRHLVVYELDYSESETGVLEPIGATSFPYLHRQSGSDDLDSCFSARPLDAGERQRGYLSLGDRGDYYRLKSYARGTLQVEFDGNVKAFGELLDIEGRPLANNKGREETENFVIERHVDDGVYYLRVAKSWGDSGHYNLRTKVVPASGEGATDRDDDTAQLATHLGLGVEVGDAIDGRGDVDWWSFSTHSPGRLVIESSGGTDTHGSLLDRFREELAMNDDGGEGENFRIDDPTVFEAGNYYVKVTGNRHAVTGPYTLRVVHFPEDGSGQPDLVVEFLDEGNLELMPNEPLLPSARVRNRGNGSSELTALRLFQSENRVISTADMRAGTELVDPIEALTSSLHFVRFTGFAQSGSYYVGGCVRPVEGESNTDNNCSAALRVVVSDNPSAGAAEPVVRRYSVPLLLSTSDNRRQGFVRIVNRSKLAGRVELFAVDDAGLRHGPYELALGAQETVHFDSEDLESGNPDLGIMAGTGIGQGNWWLELTTALDIAALAYVRTPDGFLTSVHDTAATLDDGRYYVPLFNPASNSRQRSSLRLVNPGVESADITITGIDDRGKPSPDGDVWLSLPAGEARVITARDLESGGGILQGKFGAGSGKWRLFLESTAPIDVLSLLDSPTGNLSNLSSRGGKRSLPFVLPDTEADRKSFVRIVNWSDSRGAVRIRGVDDSGQQTTSITLSLNASSAVNFNSGDLETGNEHKGLADGIGPGEGVWRLDLQSDLDLEALAYVRTADGFVTGMHGLAVDAQGIVDVPIFNPGSDTNPQSRLRLINPGGMDARATLTGWDDMGRRPPYGTTRVTVPAGKSLTITARELEAGTEGLHGRFGDGIGKWRLAVASEQPIQVMSLLQGPTGNLANLSGSGGEPRVTANGKGPE